MGERGRVEIIYSNDETEKHIVKENWKKNGTSNKKKWSNKQKKIKHEKMRMKT